VYCSVELPFVRAASGDVKGNVPAELEGHSIMLAGTLADGSPFSVLSKTTPVARLVADSRSFELSVSHSKLLVAFDVAAWLSALDWASATKRNGAVFVSASENSALLADFEARLASGIAVYRDDDGDGVLDERPERLAHGE
jgi:hypothetical protein